MSPFKVGVVVIVAAVVVTYLGFSKDVPFLNPEWEIQAAFRDTSGLDPGAPVRIAGVDVGKVTRVEHTSPGASAALVTMAIRDRGRPIHTNARARIRPRIFLEGNFFVDLSPGTPAAPQMEQGGTIPVEHTSNPVQVDQILKALKADTREDVKTTFRELLRTQAAGGGEAFNRSLRYQPDAYRFSAIVAEAMLGRQPGDLGDFIRDAGVVAQAVDRQPERLKSLVTNFNTTAAALADREAALRRAVDELPTTLNEALPTFTELNEAFPDVRRFARAAIPAVRSTGPTVDALLPLLRQLTALVGRDELRGIADDLARAIPALAEVADTSVPLLEQQRLMSSCATNVLIPWGDLTVPDENFPAVGPVYQEAPKAFTGLTGESRSHDANGPWFKVLGGGGVETVSLGDGLFGFLDRKVVGVNPPPDRTIPPFEPDVPCETQQLPNLQTRPDPAPPAVDTRSKSPKVLAREEKAKRVSIEVLQALLKAEGKDWKVVDTNATLDDIRRQAARNGLTRQLDAVLARKGR